MDAGMHIDMEAIREVFVAEAADALAEMEAGLMALEKRPDDPEALNLVFRHAHTIKGSASTLGLGDVCDVAHAMEDVLDELRLGAVPYTPSLATMLLRGVDALRAVVPAAVAGQQGLPPEAQRVIDDLADRGGPRSEGSRAGAEAAPAQPSFGVASPDDARRARSFRVDAAKLDRLLDLTGEIAIARGRLEAAVASLAGAERERVASALWEADALHRDLQEEVLKVRMVPLAPVLRPLARMVRDLSMDLGKLARLELEGDDVEVDMTVMEHLRDPLTHMLRNAVDHGLEYPREREAAGKPTVGTICISARHDRGSVVLELRDDGAGLDLPRLLARAEALGLVAPGELPADDEIRRLIFHPGFSTAQRITELSGRGVGMDVVKRNVEHLRGTIAVESERGRGTCFTIRLPLTLAIIQGFAVGVGPETYLVPLDSVTECLRLPSELKQEMGASAVLHLRGDALPLLRLRSFFSADGGAPATEHVLVVHDQNGAAGIVVDALHGERQAVVKPLGRLFDGLPGISGSTILGSGRVALLLDVPSILDEARSRRLPA